MVFAYLDPATGGMVIQSIIAAAVTVPFLLRTQIARGWSKLRGTRSAESSKEPPTTSD